MNFKENEIAHRIHCAKKIMVISPHLDDAVLSLGGLIAEYPGPIRIVTVCSSSGKIDAPAAKWDRLSGFTQADEAFKLRKIEDTAACNELHVKWQHLEFGDYPYVGEKQPYIVAKTLQNTVTIDELVLAPSGYGLHPDHVMVRDAVKHLDASPKGNILYYADLPYAGKLLSQADQQGTQSEILDALKRIWLSPKEVYLRSLAEVYMSKKLRAVKQYRSQLSPLRDYFPSLLNIDGCLAKELIFSI